MPSTPSSPPSAVSEGEIVSIITWILLITSLLAILARLSTKWAVSKTLHIDDVFVVAAMLCHIGSGTAVSVEDRNGLGSSAIKHYSAQADTFAKSSYAADLLFIATLGFAKLSMILLFNLISQQRRHRHLNMALGTFTSIAFVAFFLAGAFSCRLPSVWDVFSRCYDRAAFWYAFGIINIVTDVALVIFPIYIMARLQMSIAKKLMVLSCFGTRLFDVAAIAVQLTYVRAFRSVHFTADLWPWVLISQFVQCITVVTSCIPYLKPLLESFPSGLFMSDEIRRKGIIPASSDGYVKTSDSSYVLRPAQSNNLTKSDQSLSHVKAAARTRFTDLDTITVASATALEVDSENARLWENQGMAGNAGTVKTTLFYTT